MKAPSRMFKQFTLGIEEFVLMHNLGVTYSFAGRFFGPRLLLMVFLFV